MANRTITQLTEETSPQSSDLLIIQNSTLNLTKKVQAQNLIKPFIQNVSTVVQSNSANWDDVYTTFKGVSSTFLTSELDQQTLSFDDLTKDLSISNGNTISLSALTDITSTDTGVRELTANWEDTYTTFKNVSSTFLTSETDSQTLSFDDLTKDLSISNGNTISLSALISLTAVDTEVRDLTANWQDTFTNVQSNSADWKLADFIVTCSDETSNLVTSVSSFTFRAPFEMILDSVRASVTTAPSGSDIIIDVLQNNSSIFSTLLTIDEEQNTSTTSVTPAVISTSDLIDDAKIVVAINQVGSIDPGTGLKLTFKGYRV